MAQPGKKSARSTKQKPKKSVPEFAKPFYKKRWFAVFTLILVFSGIGGGYMIRKGNAASYTFIRRAPQITHVAEAFANQEKKSDGITYKLISSNGYGVGFLTMIRTFMTKQEAAKSDRVCAHFKVFDSQGRSTKITIVQKTPDLSALSRKTVTYSASTPSGNVCVYPIYDIDSYIEVQSLDGGIVGVDTIYGKPASSSGGSTGGVVGINNHPDKP